jgi:hypothetical protein
MVNSNNFEVLEVYPYPSFVQEKIVVYNENENCGEKHVKQLFEDLLTTTSDKIGHHLMDNKIAMKIRGHRTGTILYIGYKDNIYSVGLSLFTETTKKIHISD